ncbi:hypothetical protein [Streptomyces sp. NBC_00268]|nr:hypothetical protein [Streptomyces sp. NBC_00268]MCX5184253.1 hypothetical protein [Streptomyces sp. NBC_00268]
MLFDGAVATHLRRGEETMIVGDLIYLVLAPFAAWSRSGLESCTG